MSLEQNKEIALSVSRAILNGKWKELDGLLGDTFTYTGDSAVYSRDEYFGFMQALKDAIEFKLLRDEQRAKAEKQ